MLQNTRALRNARTSLRRRCVDKKWLMAAVLLCSMLLLRWFGFNLDFVVAPAVEDQYGNLRLGTYIDQLPHADWAKCDDGTLCRQYQCEPGSVMLDQWHQCPDGSYCALEYCGDPQCVPVPAPRFGRRCVARCRVHSEPVGVSQRPSYPWKTARWNEQGLCRCDEHAHCAIPTCFTPSSHPWEECGGNVDWRKRVCNWSMPGDSKEPVERDGAKFRLPFMEGLRRHESDRLRSVGNGMWQRSVTVLLAENGQLHQQMEALASGDSAGINVWVCHKERSYSALFWRSLNTLPGSCTVLAMQAVTKYVARFEDSRMPPPLLPLVQLHHQISAAEETAPLLLGSGTQEQCLHTNNTTTAVLPGLPSGHWLMLTADVHTIAARGTWLRSSPMSYIACGCTTASCATSTPVSQIGDLHQLRPGDLARDSRFAKALEVAVQCFGGGSGNPAGCNTIQAESVGVLARHPVQGALQVLKMVAALHCHVGSPQAASLVAKLREATADPIVTAALSLGEQASSHSSCPIGDQQEEPTQAELVDGVTVVLNVFQRMQNLAMQLDLLAVQTLQPHQIWVCAFGVARENVAHFQQVIDDFQHKYPTVKVQLMSSSFNFKYFGRFQVALHAQTRYVAFLDDDQMPGETSLQLFYDVAEGLEQPAILGLTGRAFSRPTVQHGLSWYHGKHKGFWYQNSCAPDTTSGDVGPECKLHVKGTSTRLCAVDGLNRHFFVPTRLIKWLFAKQPFTFSTMEDFTLSVNARKYGGFQSYTICPTSYTDTMQLYEGSTGTSTDKFGTSTNAFRGNMLKMMYWQGYAPVVTDETSCNPAFETCPERVVIGLWDDRTSSCGSRSGAQQRIHSLNASICLVRTHRALVHCLESEFNIHCVDTSGPQLQFAISSVVIAVYEVLCLTSSSSRRVELTFDEHDQNSMLWWQRSAMQYAGQLHTKFGCKRSTLVLA